MSKDDAKVNALKKHRTLNPHPERVGEERFVEHDFFDPRDLLQVKYEMVRRVQLEGRPLTRSAEEFGFSRPSLYSALQAFEKEGLAGLIPRRRGPKQAHKLNQERMAFLEQALASDPTLRARGLAELLQERFHVGVHPRSIERALARHQKKRPKSPSRLSGGASQRKKS